MNSKLTAEDIMGAAMRMGAELLGGEFLSVSFLTRFSSSSPSCEFRDELRENRFELLKDLVRFFKEYMPLYGDKHLCTEDDDYKYYQTLNLPCIKRGFMGRHCNYGAPLREIEV